MRISYSEAVLQLTMAEQKTIIANDKAAVAFKAFFNIAKAWKLSEEEKRTLLGQIDTGFMKGWEDGNGPEANRDTLERISYVLGIFKAINILLPQKERATEWMRSPNSAPILGGKSALERMAAGNVSDLYVVRQYLDAELMGADSRPPRNRLANL